jgi:hypothetical protein
MLYRHLRHLAVSAAVLGLAFSLTLFAQDTTHRGRKYKAPPPTSRIDVTILRNEDGKPVENAAVVFQLVGDKGNMELKTNEDGKTMIDVLPTGSKVVVQVIAKGFQTYGRDYRVDKPEMAIEVRLKRPGQQYSIYEDHSESATTGQSPDAGKSSDKEKSTDAKKDAVQKDSSQKDSSKDEPAESAKQSGAKPDASKPQPQ